MPRAKKPTALNIIDGNPGKRALNRNEPKYGAIEGYPEPPLYLDELAIEAWEFFAPQLVNSKVLTIIDLNVLAGYCVNYSKWIRAEEQVLLEGFVVEGPQGAKKNPAQTVAIESQAMMIKYGNALGLDPSSRSKIIAPGGEDPGNRYAKLKGRK